MLINAILYFLASVFSTVTTCDVSPFCPLFPTLEKCHLGWRRPSNWHLWQRTRLKGHAPIGMGSPGCAVSDCCLLSSPLLLLFTLLIFSNLERYRLPPTPHPYFISPRVWPQLRRGLVQNVVLFCVWFAHTETYIHQFSWAAWVEITALCGQWDLEVASFSNRLMLGPS